MSRRRLSLGPPFALALWTIGGCPATSLAGPRLDVAGEVLATEPRLSVRVLVTNRGDAPAPGIEVSGEWQGERRMAPLAPGLGAGATGSVVLDFEPGAAGPGVHVLPLLLEHVLAGPSDAGGNPPLASERAWLLVAFGSAPAPAVRLHTRPLELDVHEALQVELESTDGRPHRVRLRGLTARGVRIEGSGSDVEVPESGRVQAQLHVLRAGALRGTRHGVLLVAETRDGETMRTTVATAAVEIAPDPALLPRARKPLLALGLALLASVVAVEAWRAFRPPRHA